MRDALLRGAERAELLHERLLRAEPRVAHGRVGDLGLHASRVELVFALIVVQERVGETNADVVRVRQRLTADAVVLVEAVPRPLEASDRSSGRYGVRDGPRRAARADSRCACDCSHERALVEHPGKGRAVDRCEGEVERVRRLRRDRRRRADEARERGAGDAQVVARRDHRELRVADRDDGAQRVGQRGDAGPRARRSTPSAAPRPARAAPGRGLRLARGEDAVVLRLHLERDVELLATSFASAASTSYRVRRISTEPATAVEHVERGREAGAVAPRLRREIRHEAALVVESIAGLVHLPHGEVEAREQRGARGAHARFGIAHLPARLDGREPVLLGERDRLAQRDGTRRERVGGLRAQERPEREGARARSWKARWASLSTYRTVASGVCARLRVGWRRPSGEPRGERAARE